LHKEASSSFFEKKEPKKLFPLCARGRLLTGQPMATRPNGQKFFWFFFFKKRTASLG
jgi:hypothetical protein